MLYGLLVPIGYSLEWNAWHNFLGEQCSQKLEWKWLVQDPLATQVDLIF
jgi:hypothetical protein